MVEFEALHRTRAEHVAERLREMILSGELAPGERLRQTDIAVRFAVSTTPVREAFTSLAREGFVRHDAHRGVEVFRPTVREIRENYEIRLALEPLATELAVPNITPAVLSDLERLLEEMEGVAEFRFGTALNRDFHFAIYRVADRPQLLDMIERLRRAADAYVHLLAANSPPPRYREAVQAEHREIVAALAARAPRRAHRAMAQHLRHNLTEISEIVPGAD